MARVELGSFLEKKLIKIATYDLDPRCDEATGVTLTFEDGSYISIEGCYAGHEGRIEVQCGTKEE